MTHATAWEAHELRPQVGNHLSQVSPQSVLPVHKGLLRKERNHIDTHVGHLQGHDGQSGLGIVGLGGEHSRELLPFAGVSLQLALGQHITIGAYQLNGEVLLLTATQHVH